MDKPRGAETNHLPCGEKGAWLLRQGLYAGQLSIRRKRIAASPCCMPCFVSWCIPSSLPFSIPARSTVRRGLQTVLYRKKGDGVIKIWSVDFWIY